MENNSWEKEYHKLFNELLETGDKLKKGYDDYEYWSIHDALKSFIAVLLNDQRETPMGVSQWKAHGEKYGYFKYFSPAAYEAGATAERNRAIKVVNSATAITQLGVCDQGTKEGHAYYNGQYDFRRTILALLTQTNSKNSA